DQELRGLFVADQRQSLDQLVFVLHVVEAGQKQWQRPAVLDAVEELQHGARRRGLLQIFEGVTERQFFALAVGTDGQDGERLRFEGFVTSLKRVGQDRKQFRVPHLHQGGQRLDVQPRTRVFHELVNCL